jgi:predicted DNA-binding protein
MTETRVKALFRLREDLYTKLRFLSASTGESMNEIMNKALEEYLNKHIDEIRKKYVEVIQQA